LHNDNFENLLYESGLTAQGCWDELDEYAQKAVMRFGQLIVQDCIQVIHKQEQIPEGFFYAKTAHIHELEIKQHFGIDNE
jgi:hypothetical protein